MQFFDVLETLTPMCLFNREMLEEKISRLYATSQIDHHEGPMIQVMTIHKAKGLEFDHVFIPALERSARPEEQPLLLWQEQYVEGEWKMLLAPIKRRERAEHSALYRFLYELEQEKAFFESQRLLYVATTRAKKALYLSAATGDEPDFKPSKNSFLSWIWPYVTTHFHPAPQMPLKPQQERLAMPTEEPERVPFEANLRGSLSSVYSIESEENQDLNIPEFPHQHCPVERAIGIVVHRYLAEIADQHLQGWQQTHFEAHKTFIAAQLRQEGVLSIGLDQATNEVIALLNQVIRDEKALWILSPHEESACELVLTEVQGERVQTRVIDRTFVDQGIRWIIDYKTADLPPEAPLDAFLEREWERYQPQLQLYARLMRALEGGRYPIKTALYFVRQGLLKVETEVLSDAMV
ncbi:MAG: hypothetical protein EBX40_04585 [Gammaproteobacteria bacterium]|nr:hypothetical protein [Gammaproteobacteria bacterium]